MRGRWKLLSVSVLLAVSIWLSAASAAQAGTISATCRWGTQSQTCDSTTWYPSSVSVTWQASPPPDNPTTGCELGIAYHYDTDTVNTVSCSATWSGPSPSSASQQYTLHVETSTPTVSVTPARPADSNGWYNHPVAAAITASSYSGIASCTPTTYSGPDATNATVSGTCIDNAGKVTNRSVGLNYDATAPTITGVTASRSPDFNGWYTHPVLFTFAGTDSVSGIDSCATVTYSGPDSARGSALGTCRDRAGNVATLAVPLRYDSTRPPVLRWRTSRHAIYYNLQVYRNGRKVLSSWPTHATLPLSRSWSFAGHRFHLRPGRYRWYVWPGFGSRTAARYGPMIGTGTFVVTRRS
jgi:hypothetical protein